MWLGDGLMVVHVQHNSEIDNTEAILHVDYTDLMIPNEADNLIKGHVPQFEMEVLDRLIERV